MRIITVMVMVRVRVMVMIAIMITITIQKRQLQLRACRQTSAVTLSLLYIVHLDDGNWSIHTRMSAHQPVYWMDRFIHPTGRSTDVVPVIQLRETADVETPRFFITNEHTFR